MTEYLWSSPGGLYIVPDAWRRRFLSEFPDYRVRWSLEKQNWQIEQRYYVGWAPGNQWIDATKDINVRANDGYWLVMQTQPGDRMACPVWLTQHPPVRCGATIKLQPRRPGEVRCEACRAAGRDGRTVATYWPFDETLLERLRSTNPLTRGVVKIGQKVQTRAAVNADAANAARDREDARRLKDRTTSIDAVDYRWIAGIASSTGLRRHTIDEKDLE